MFICGECNVVKWSHSVAPHVTHSAATVMIVSLQLTVHRLQYRQLNQRVVSSYTAFYYLPCTFITHKQTD